MKYLNPNRRLLKPNKNKLFNEKIKRIKTQVIKEKKQALSNNEELKIHFGIERQNLIDIITRDCDHQLKSEDKIKIYEKIIILSKELNLDENQYKMYIKAIELLKKP